MVRMISPVQKPWHPERRASSERASSERASSEIVALATADSGLTEIAP
jgi:hypothetical protein